MRHSNKKTNSIIFKSIIIIFSSVIISNIIFSNFIFANVNGPSMEPTLNDQNLILIFKNAYIRTTPKFLDIVAIKSKNKNNPPIIKRIIASPNDKLEIKNSKVFVNGFALSEPYIKETMHNSNISIILPKDNYFVMGDNRNNSIDSRDFSIGLISSDEILGKAVISINPLKRIYP